MRNIKKQDYKTVLFLGAFISDAWVELMSTESGREGVYHLLRLYKEGKARGGEINANDIKYKMVIG